MPGSEDRISATIFRLLHARSAGATICPSEVARTLAPNNWQPLMPRVRAAALSLARDGRLELRQRGVAIDLNTEMRGPIRLALPDE